jgi:hypothetical protein
MDTLELLRMFHEDRLAQQIRETMNAELDLDVRPAVMMVQNGDKLRAFRYDAHLLAGLTDLDIRLIEIEKGDNMRHVLPVFEGEASSADYFRSILTEARRSLVIAEYDESRFTEAEETDEFRSRFPVP